MKGDRSKKTRQASSQKQALNKCKWLELVKMLMLIIFIDMSNQSILEQFRAFSWEDLQGDGSEAVQKAVQTAQEHYDKCTSNVSTRFIALSHH